MKKLSLLFALLLSLTLLAGCDMPELPPLPTVTPEPTAAPMPFMTAAPSPEIEAEPEPEETAEPSPEPTARALQPLALNETCLNRSVFADSSEPGSLHTAEYEAKNYSCEEYFTKRLTVYLPYGYDESRQYNVLFLLHTAGGSENTWLVDPTGYRFTDGMETVRVKNMLDNLIQEGLCEPMIVVCPSGYLAAGAIYADSSFSYDQFDYEFANNILPYVAEHYATYAEGGSHEQLVAARDHFGVLGASYGSYLNYISIFATHMDLVSNYCFVGGGPIEYDYIKFRWNTRGFEDFKLHCVYIVEGEHDDRMQPELSYRYLLNNASQYFSDENLHFSVIYGAGHEGRSWINGLYNAAQIFFRDDPYPIPYVGG